MGDTGVSNITDKMWNSEHSPTKDFGWYLDQMEVIVDEQSS